MPTLQKKNWPLGWIPSDAEISGRADGLVRADNLTQDENGIWRLIRGTKKVSSGPFPSYINTIYSRYLNGKKLRYVSYNGSVMRNYGGLNSLTDFDSGTLGGGGSASYATFGTGFGHNFIISGGEKKKDNGTNLDNTGTPNPSFNLGIGPPVAPSLVKTTPYSKDVSGKDGSGNFSWWDTAAIEGSGYAKASTYVSIDSDASTFRAVVQRGLDTALTLDANDITGLGYKGVDSDVFEINVRIGDTATFVSVKVEFLLETPSAGVPINNLYEKEWIFRWERTREGTRFDPTAPDLTPTEITPDELTRIQRRSQEGERFHALVFNQSFNQGINAWTALQCQRGDFTRLGTDDDKDWSTVKGIRVTFTGLESQTYLLNDLSFEGGPLTGKFTYKQVDVYRNDNYKEFGIPSDDSVELNVVNAGVRVNYTYSSWVGNQINEIWIYRRSEFTGGFYKIAEVTTPSASGYINDEMTDAEAMQLNEQLPVYATLLPGDISDMVCDYFNRNLYMTNKEVIPSYKDNPGLYDSRYVLNIGGDKAEVNLFMKKVSNSSILIGTTKDIYELTGDGTEIELMDGVVVLDYKLRALGVEAPPVSIASTVHDGALIYLSHDGWHILQGSSNQVFSQELSLLYLKETRHGINEVIVPIANSSYVACIVAKNKFWASVDHVTIGRSLHVFNFKTKTWEFRRYGAYGQNPQAMFVEEDGTILYSTTAAGDLYLREYDVGTLYDEITNIDFTFRTVFDDNGQPRNRKDLYTLRLGLNTGNVDVSVVLRAMDDTSTVYSKTYTAQGNGYTNLALDINTYISTPVKRMQLEISGSVPSLEIHEFSIDYDARPEQLNFLILKPENFGVAGRKRIPTLPLVIDTMGANVTFTPTIDGGNRLASTVNTTIKNLHTHYFTVDEVGYMFGGVLSGNLFEYYGLVPPRNVEVLPDPTKYKFTNHSNLGTTSRKRFIQYGRIIDCKGGNVTITPQIEGVSFTPLIVTSARKKTHIYPFTGDVIGVDIACILEGTGEFEDYGESLEDSVFEKLPPITKTKFTNYSNLGSASRKRFVQYARVIDTLGHDVYMSPYVDGTAYPAMTLNSTRKQTFVYPFTTNVEGIEIACLLACPTGEFEDYGPNLEECITEKLPRSTKFINLSTTNFEIANKKRIRTLPFVINTRGGIVTYTPNVDGVAYPVSSLISTEKRTLLHLFATDSFGIDYGGTLSSPTEFEFYEMLKPEIVQILPVGKIFDQLGPIQFNKIGKLRELRLRIVPEGTSLAYEVFSADTSILTGSFTTVPNKEDVYTIKFPRGINPTICRVTLLGSSIFYRLNAEFKVHIEGKTPEFRYITENGEEV